MVTDRKYITNNFTSLVSFLNEAAVACTTAIPESEHLHVTI